LYFSDEKGQKTDEYIIDVIVDLHLGRLQEHGGIRAFPSYVLWGRKAEGRGGRESGLFFNPIENLSGISYRVPRKAVNFLLCERIRKRGAEYELWSGVLRRYGKWHWLPHLSVCEWLHASLRGVLQSGNLGLSVWAAL